jgi:hypothetical protein
MTNLFVRGVWYIAQNSRLPGKKSDFFCNIRVKVVAQSHNHVKQKFLLVMSGGIFFLRSL